MKLWNIEHASNLIFIGKYTRVISELEITDFSRVIVSRIFPS